MTNKEIYKLFRESNEASFMVFLENNIEWKDPEQLFEDGGTIFLRELENDEVPITRHSSL